MQELEIKSRQIRSSILDIFIKGGRGHVPSAFSLVEILSTLYYQRFSISLESFDSFDRDRVILSKGHGCLALYAILADLNFFDASEFDLFCKVGGILGGHPSRKIPGVEVSTGSLGHGLSVGVGMAISLKRKSFKRKVVAILGDGECNEGSVWEAALSASKNKLDNLIVIIDHNKQQSYGTTEEVCSLSPFPDKWRSFGFETFEVDMVNDSKSLLGLLENTSSPRAIICHTIKGQGSTILENNISWHHRNKVLPKEEQDLRNSLK